MIGGPSLKNYGCGFLVSEDEITKTKGTNEVRYSHQSYLTTLILPHGMTMADFMGVKPEEKKSEVEVPTAQAEEPKVEESKKEEPKAAAPAPAKKNKKPQPKAVAQNP